MPCYHPQTAWRALTGRNQETGNWPIVFNRNEGYKDMELQVPCGNCIGCRLERSRQWATRCMFEASLHDENCFVTLTYSPDYLPEGATLVKKDVQNFMKRLRKAGTNGKFKYFLCGEYGENFNRPHYHICFFNLDFVDKEIISRKKDKPLYISANSCVFSP